MKKLKSNKTVMLCRSALGTAIISICALVALPPIGIGVPYTLQSFAVCAISCILGGTWGALSTLIYIVLGILGLPVFAGMRGGPGAFTHISGGYIIGFLATALIVGFSCKKFGRGFMTCLWSMTLGMLACYAVGTAWFVFVYSKENVATGFASALTVCVVPYILPDALKIIAAAIVGEKLGKVIKPMDCL